MHPKSNSSLINSIYITDELQKVYYNADERTRSIKSAFAGLCSDIDRYFRLALKIDIPSPVSGDAFEKAIEVFPLLSGLSIDLFNKALSTFYALRNVNAHLFLNRFILLDEELEEFFTRKAAPLFAVSQKRHLTLYGSFYFLTFFSQKYQLWPFVTSCFQNGFFEDISSDDLSAFQIKIQHYHQSFCGNGKPLFEKTVEDKTETLFLNDTCKRSMTEIFFDLERALHTNKKPQKTANYFSTDLRKEKKVFQSNDLVDDIINLRNCWFHGCSLYDTIKTNDHRTFEYNLSFVIKVFSEITQSSRSDIRFDKVRTDIHCFGSALFDFYVLKLVEVSYKIIDNRLLTTEKFASRIDDLGKAFDRFMIKGHLFYEKIAPLLHDKKRWKLSSFKFTDKIPRCVDSSPLQILQLHSNKGFDIGEYHTDLPSLTIALVDLDKRYQNKINGKYLSDFKYISQSFYSENICVCTQSE